MEREEREGREGREREKREREQSCQLGREELVKYLRAQVTKAEAKTMAGIKSNYFVAYVCCLCAT